MKKLSTLRKKSLLYVEDDALLLESTSKLLSIFFENITLSQDGAEALELIQKSEYQVLFLDISLPHVSGMKLAKAAKTKERNSFVCMTTSFDDKQTLLDAIHTGVDAFLVKPFSFEELFGVLVEFEERLASREESIVSLGENLFFNSNTKVLLRDSDEIKLTNYELILVDFIVKNRAKTISYAELNNLLYGTKYSDNSQAGIQNILYRLRRKTAYKWLESIDAYGYRVCL